MAISFRSRVGSTCIPNNVLVIFAPGASSCYFPAGNCCCTSSCSTW